MATVAGLQPLAAYGAIRINGGSTAQTAITTTPALMTGWNTAAGVNGLSLNTTPAKASNKITVGVAGNYLVCFQLSFSGTANSTCTARLYVGGVAQDQAFTRKLGSGGDVGSASFVGIATIAANADVEIYLASDNAGAGDSYTPQNAQLTVVRVG